VVTWGAGGYGQLGDGFAWDNPRPQVVPMVKNVICMSAGMRHSVVAAGVGGIGTDLTTFADRNVHMLPHHSTLFIVWCDVVIWQMEFPRCGHGGTTVTASWDWET
jgi:hypothetical protein